MAGARHRRRAGAPGGVGVRPSLWRTPWGDTAPWSAGIAREHDLRLVGWTVDTHDWRGDGAAEMFEATRAVTHGRRDRARPRRHRARARGARARRRRSSYVELVGEHAREHGLGLEALVSTDQPARAHVAVPRRGARADRGRRRRTRSRGRPAVPRGGDRRSGGGGGAGVERAAGGRPAAGGGRARAGAPCRPGRRLGRPDLRRPSQRGRAAGGPGAGGRCATASWPRSAPGGCASACGAGTRARARARRRRS